LVDADFQGAFQAADVGHQGGVDDAAAPADAAHHFLGVGQRRNGLGRGEAGDLDAREAAVGQGVDEGDFVVGGNLGFFDLQAVARADFVDLDAGGSGVHAMTPRARNCARWASVRPAWASTASVCSPSVGARSRIAPGLSDSSGNTAGISTRTPLAPWISAMALRAR